MICSLTPSPTTSKPEGWWIERATPGWSLTSTGRGRRRDNAPYLRPTTCLRLFADWMTSALLATGAANAGKLSGHEQQCCRRTVLSGSAVSAIEGTDAIEKNCARDLLPLVGI